MAKAQAKTKSRPVKKAAPAKRKKSASTSKKRLPPKRLTDSLQKRLQNEFAQSMERAELYLADPERLRDLITEATVKVRTLPRAQLSDMWPQLQTMLRLATAYSQAQFVEVSPTALLQIIAALLYLVNPLDLLPDAIPGIGLLDDIFILGLTIRRTRNALEQFARWESE